MATDRSSVKVKGLRDLQRACRMADKGINKDLRSRLRGLGDRVRVTAENYASNRIPNITGDWSRMRIGLTARQVYVAPKMRQTSDPSRKRPNFANLLMDRAMQPAVDVHENDTITELEHMLDGIERDWSRGGW